MKVQPAILFLWFFLFIVCAPASAQSSVDAFTTTYVSGNNAVNYASTPASNSNSFSSCSNTNFTYSFNNGSANLLKLIDITTNHKVYYIANNTSAVVKLRRVNNASVTGNRSVISMESTLTSTANCPTSNQISLKTPYQDVMENFLNTNYINQGTDNIFTNSGNGDGNNNNIERVDVIFPSGMASSITTDAGFAVFDRGVNLNHDGFRIAAITSLDSQGDPASFGTLKTCTKGNGTTNGSWGHPSTANGNKTLAVYVLRKEQSETKLKVSSTVNQQVGGVFFSFADLGISAGQRIYGYSVLSTDGMANPTSAQLLNLNDASVYPTNTTEAFGGLDMMAINAVFETSLNPLSIKKAELIATMVNDQVEIKWNIEGTDTNTKSLLERSYNNTNFTALYQISSASNSSAGIFYDKPDQTAYYRLRITDENSKLYFSKIVFVPKKNKTVSIYPTILRAGQNLTIKGLDNGNYRAVLTTTNGSRIQLSIKATAGSAVINAQLLTSLKGMVCLSFEDANSCSIPAGKLIIE